MTVTSRESGNKRAPTYIPISPDYGVFWPEVYLSYVRTFGNIFAIRSGFHGIDGMRVRVRLACFVKFWNL